MFDFIRNVPIAAATAFQRRAYVIPQWKLLFAFIGTALTAPGHAADISHQPNPGYLMHGVFSGSCPESPVNGMLPDNFYSLASQPDPWTFQPFSSGESAL